MAHLGGDWSESYWQLSISRLTIAQGALGTVLIRLNALAAVYRRNSAIHEWPILEVVSFAAITGAVSYLVREALLFHIVIV